MSARLLLSMLPTPLRQGVLLSLAALAWGQTPAPPAGPLIIDLPQALARARQYGGQVQSANLTLSQATQDRVQARAAMLPQASALSQYIHTQANGTPSGVFVSNDGVHVFNDQGVVHQDVLPVFMRAEQQRAAAAEALARARVDVASRGVNAVVIQDFYAIADAVRKLNNATLSLSEARQFLDISQKQESGGEVAHADVVKAQIQLQQRQVDLNEAQTVLAKAKIALAVLIFPDFQTEYSIKDDLEQTDLVPPLPEVRTQAVATNPDVKAASAAVDEAGYEVDVAHYGYLPTVSLDFFYGINANQFAVHNPDGNLLLGNVAQVTVNVPVWNWGATKSKVKQAELRQDQAKLDLSLTQRQLQGALASAHAEAEGALGQVSLLRQGEDYAAESLKLTLLRYQAGEATAFEVTDAQSTVKQARDAYDDGLARYRIALANLRTLMGTL
jgi:outer membrane protein TolC